MSFNSLDFGLFLPVVFVLYWGVFAKHLRLQNAFLLGASYFFYGSWDWRFLSLIIISSAVDYALAILIEQSGRRRIRRMLVGMSLLVNLGLLVYFKYAGFFVESFFNTFTFLGHSISSPALSIVLPVGISFYTFQTLSYTIDVYRGRMKASREPIAFFAYVAFFPQLVAGPIERAWRFLPQFMERRVFDSQKATDGMRQMLWGLFKKVVVADHCAVWANEIFSNHEKYGGAVLVLGTVFFAVQIYGDFSGYTDIAIGTGRLFGFSIMRNFAFPYFARDIAEFWRRWHISLTSWFKDYLYKPLGGNRFGLAQSIRNVVIVFLVSGFWHGANWAFIVWGGLHALYYLPILIAGRHRKHLYTTSKGRMLPGFMEALRMIATFMQVCFAWIFLFRADNLSEGFEFARQMLTQIHLHPGGVLLFLNHPECLFVILLFAVEWLQRERSHGLDFSGLKIPTILRWLIYILLANALLYFDAPSQEFIYFQF